MAKAENVSSLMFMNFNGMELCLLIRRGSLTQRWRWWESFTRAVGKLLKWICWAVRLHLQPNAFVIMSRTPPNLFHLNFNEELLPNDRFCLVVGSEQTWFHKSTTFLFRFFCCFELCRASSMAHVKRPGKASDSRRQVKCWEIYS